MIALTHAGKVRSFQWLAGVHPEWLVRAASCVPSSIEPDVGDLSRNVAALTVALIPNVHQKLVANL